MGQAANTFDAYDAGTSNAEDVQDKIYMVSPEATPVLSAGRRFKAQQKSHEWLRDSLATPSVSNAVIEGDERTGTAITAPGRVGNLTQLMDKVAVISTTQEKLQGHRAFVGDEVPGRQDVQGTQARLGSAHGVQQRSGGRQLQHGAERRAAWACLSTPTPCTTALARRLRTLRGFPTAAVTGGTNRAFAEPLVKTAMQSVYTNSGDMPTFVSLTPSHKATFSGFTGLASSRINTSVKGTAQATIIGGADLYISDFGTLAIVPELRAGDQRGQRCVHPEQGDLRRCLPPELQQRAARQDRPHDEGTGVGGSRDCGDG